MEGVKISSKCGEGMSYQIDRMFALFGPEKYFQSIKEGIADKNPFFCISCLSFQ
jgi:hypothetical protein